jgi:hypothetical protein
MGRFSGMSIDPLRRHIANCYQYPWGSAHNLAPLILGIVLLIAFFVWEFYAPYPMVPRALFSKAKKTMIVILLITFLSGGNYFVMLLFWPTQVYNVYGKHAHLSVSL